VKIIKNMHHSPIRMMKFISNLDLVMTADDKGIIEFWDPETYGTFF
jgi:hypothetical protein